MSGSSVVRFVRTTASALVPIRPVKDVIDLINRDHYENGSGFASSALGGSVEVSGELVSTTILG